MKFLNARRVLARSVAVGQSNQKMFIMQMCNNWLFRSVEKMKNCEMCFDVFCFDFYQIGRHFPLCRPPHDMPQLHVPQSATPKLTEMKSLSDEDRFTFRRKIREIITRFSRVAAASFSQEHFPKRSLSPPGKHSAGVTS